MKTCDLISDEGKTVIQPHPPGQTPGAALAQFWERRGCPVVESGGVFWRRFKGPFYTPIPTHLRLDPEKGEIEELLRRSRIVGVRFPVCGPGIPAGLYVVRPASYTLASVSRKQRANVIRGLERCEIRRVEQDELTTAGILLNRDTMKRQTRHDPELDDPRRWAHFVSAVYACPSFEVTGAYVDGRLATYVICYREGSWLHLLYKMSRTEELEHRPNHALDYAVIRRAAGDPSVLAVANSITPFDNPGLDQYKRRMGYELVPHPLAVQFHPALSPWIVNHAALGAVNVLRRAFPRRFLNAAARVVEGAIASRTGDRESRLRRLIETVKLGGSHGLAER